mgnify:CR=1 FL=1|jgi:hypothetical protein
MQNAMITKTINHIKENVNIYEGVKIEMVTVHHANYISTETKTYSYLADKDKFYYTHGGILGMMDYKEALDDILYTIEMADSYDKITIYNRGKEIARIKKI